MDPAVQGAIIAALSALGGGAIATGSNLYLESRRQAAQELHDGEARAHEQRQQRYDERKTAYEDFYTVMSDAEQATLEQEVRYGLPGDTGHDPEHKPVDQALARIQFVASDACLVAAEECSAAFYAWGWGSGGHARLYEAMNAFVRAVRTDLDVNASSYKRPLPEARRAKKAAKPEPTGLADGQ